MSHTYYAVYEHAVFSTKQRQPWFTAQNTPALFAYLAGALKNAGCECLIVGGYQEHVHLLYRKPSDLLTRELIKELKRQSTLWIKADRLAPKEYSWQTGYGAFSVSYWDLDKIRIYIVNQREHHQKMTWEEEYRKLLRKNGVEFDERFFLD